MIERLHAHDTLHLQVPSTRGEPPWDGISLREAIAGIRAARTKCKLAPSESVMGPLSQ